MAHTPNSELLMKLEQAKDKIIIGGIYHHWKDPNTHYIVLEVGFTEWDEETVVIYQNIENKVTWVRRLEGEDGWLTPVERDGEDKSRFVLVKE